MIKRLLRTKFLTKFFIVVLLLIALGAIFIPMISPFGYAEQNVLYSNLAPFSVNPTNGYMHFFGTDTLGRDLFVRLWYGTRISLIIALAVVAIDCIIGAIYGGISGYFGGTVDQIMMRIVEVISGIPYLIIVLLLTAVLPKGLITIIIAYSITGWTGMARIVRGQVLSLCNREFIQAEKAMGYSPSRIIIHHLLPNTASVIIVSVTLDIPNVIFTEAFLSLIGLGIAPPLPSLGILCSQGILVFQSYPAQLFYPTLLIVLLSLSFNYLGDQLQDIINSPSRRIS